MTILISQPILDTKWINKPLYTPLFYAGEEANASSPIFDLTIPFLQIVQIELPSKLS